MLITEKIKTYKLIKDIENWKSKLEYNSVRLPSEMIISKLDDLLEKYQ